MYSKGFELEPAMLIYKNKVLTQFKKKSGGKNQSDVDGFYRDSDGEEFFIKKPKDPKELFTELFAGLLLHEFMRRGLIDKIYHASLICADLIQFEDGSYGLIQPKISFKELYKIIGTGYRDGSDRDPLVEMFRGPQFYLLLTQLKQYYGLATALMFSLLLGDNSVHSGNVVCLDVLSSAEMSFIQFARIDWGAAFRYFGHKKNNDELLYPFEYQGWFNPKGYTKGYFLNYKKIKGLFPAIAEQASVLHKKVSEDVLVDMIVSVLKKLPENLMESKTQIELAKYLCIDSFNHLSFGANGHLQQFAQDLAEILFNRLKKITLMQDFSTDTAGSDLSQITYVESMPTAISLPVNMVTPFAEQINIWLNILSSSDEKSIFDFNNIERDKLAQQFNGFVESLIRQAELLNNVCSGRQDLPCIDHSLQRSLFMLQSDLTPYPPSHTKVEAFDKHHCWERVEAVLNASFNAIVTIRVVQNTQNSTQYAIASAMHLLFDALKEYLEAFNLVYHLFQKELEESLSLLSGNQLASICLNEMECMDSSLLIRVVLKNEVLWTRMDRAFSEKNQLIDQEKAEDKITQLRQMHEDFTLFLTLVSELSLITKFDTKGILINEISRLFENLPSLLQTELAVTLNNIQGGFREWRRRRSLDLEAKINEENNSSSEKPPQGNLDEEQVSQLVSDIELVTCPLQRGEQSEVMPATTKILHERVLADKILWKAIVASQEKELPFDDLLILKEFYDRKRVLSTGCPLNDFSNQAVDNFYGNALKIYLSSLPRVKQAEMIRQVAHTEFALAKSDILAEALMMIDDLFGKTNFSLAVHRHTIYRLFFFHPSKAHNLAATVTEPAIVTEGNSIHVA